METGGRDPLEEDLSLDESQLVELHFGGGTKVVPPPQLPSVGSSVPHLLEGVQRAHDATLLELFETRQVLQDTRRELSQALYQNDAALRVVARLSREREEARAQLREALSSRAAAATASDAATVGTKRRRLEQDDDVMETKATKEAAATAADATVEAPPATEAAGTGVPDKIPADAMDEMVETWKRLSKGRKKRVISEDLAEPSALADFHQVGKKSLHKSSAKAGIMSLCVGGSPDGDVTLTGGRDKQAVLYSRDTHSILQTLTGATGPITAVSLLGTVAATGSSDGMLRVYTTAKTGADAEYTLVGSPVRVDNDNDDNAEEDGSTPSPVVGVHVHPTGTFVVATCQSGRVVVCSLEHPHSVNKVAAFSSPTQNEEDYTCTALHPDGLILCAGTSKGAIRIWDLKGGTIAGSLS
eukprot:scaffold25197_cov53-Attheya_sp.AAC.5